MSIKPERPVSALIGLGGNVGDVVETMQRALDTISGHDLCEVAAVSRVYKTPPWGVTDQAWFFNACAEIITSLGPEAFLDLLLKIEISEGRVREKRWGPRTLDLDIIAYGDAEIDSDRLTVPHPRMTERAFVIVPLMDIAPERTIGGSLVSEYVAVLDGSDIEQSEKKLIIPSR